MSADSQPGTGPGRLGRYALLAPLGEGGMAQVFIAQKDGAEEVCVLKQLHVQLETHTEASRRFHREAHIASQLRHPNIAEILDAGVEDGRFCLAMEFIAGQTVEDLVKEARRRGHVLPLEVSIAVLLQALEALHYAHELEGPDGRQLGLVHRDLSPRNVMLDYDGQVKVIDFGIAKGNVDEYKTQAGALMGTPYYMSPEQALATPVDHRSDLYTIAAVFFEMLAGRRLVTVKGRAKILLSVVQDAVPQVTSLTARLPKAFDDIMVKALAKEASHRYATALEFREAVLEAAGPLARTTPEILGSFVKGLFPEGPTRAAGFKALADSDTPPVEATRVAGMNDPLAPVPLSEPGQKDSRTRTAFASSGIGADGQPQLSAVEAQAPHQVPAVAAGIDAAGPEMPLQTRAAFMGEAGLVDPPVGSYAPAFDPAESAGYISASSTHDGYSTLNRAPGPNWLARLAVPALLVMGGAVGWAAYNQFKPAVPAPEAIVPQDTPVRPTAGVRARAGVRPVAAPGASSGAEAAEEAANPSDTARAPEQPQRAARTEVARVGRPARRSARTPPPAAPPPAVVPPPAAPPPAAPPSRGTSWVKRADRNQLLELQKNTQGDQAKAVSGQFVGRMMVKVRKNDDLDADRKNAILDVLRQSLRIEDVGERLRVAKRAFDL